MTASRSIKTPAMDVPLVGGPSAKDHGEELKKKFTRVTLKQVRCGVNWGMSGAFRECFVCMVIFGERA